MKEKMLLVTWGYGYDWSPHALLIGDIPEKEMQEIRVLESNIKTARETWKERDRDSVDENESLELYEKYMNQREILDEYLNKYQYIPLSDLESIDLL